MSASKLNDRSSLPPQSPSGSDALRASTSTEPAPRRSSPALQPPGASTRPSLHRQPAHNDIVSVDGQALTASPPSESVLSPGKHKHDETDMFTGPVELGESPDDATLRTLRDEMNAKLASSQRRARVKHSTSRTGSSHNVEARRVSPIKEEPLVSMSPSLQASFDSPLPTGAQTTSTGSTESAKTMKAGMSSTPAQSALRTPSYPFPYVPGTPRTWSSSFHRPFTTLSPTVSSTDVLGGGQTPRESVVSDASTPAASVATFMPAGVLPSTKVDPQYPTPNLYEMVLSLSSEPGLDAWWSALTRIMAENYRAERLSLAVPADAGELENVPWGQRATFSSSGPPEVHKPVAREVARERGPGDAPLRNVFDDAASSSGAHAARPKLQLRHSYAGFERPKSDTASPNPAGHRPGRPMGPLRTVSYAPSISAVVSFEEKDDQANKSVGGLVAFHTPDRRPAQTKSFSDPDFSVSGSERFPGPHGEVLPVLRALNYEAHALLDTVGVNKILDRGKVVTLTRDYSDEAAARRDSAAPQRPGGTVSAQLPEPRSPQETQSKGPSSGENKAPSVNLASDYFARPRTAPAYEEYEQFPSSPWAQSPAPSPAIQTDPKENPFFATGDVDEETFNPTGTPQDYSKFEQVEAIGIDKASTIVHIPLIHPVLSQLLPTRSPARGAETPTLGQSDQKPDVPVTPGSEKGPRRAPLAILSVLSPVVPYAQSLTQSLKLVAPHLATTFSNAQQYSSLHRQATGFTRRLSAGRDIGLDATNSGILMDLMEADIEISNGSVTGSITSPSDYSGRSGPSPGGSLVGTPGWESMNVGISGRQSAANTPAYLTGSEIAESYFDMKKRVPNHRGESRAAVAQSQKARGETSPGVQDYRQISIQVASDENKDRPKAEQKSSRRSMLGERKGRRDSSPKRVRIGSPKRKTGAGGQLPERMKPSLLHSYGADFSSSFQSLPAAATPTPRTPAALAMPWKTPSDEPQDMPPPSERLLRTIIDALPVQIFTAAPGTGSITWVNSKFLVYRGQDSQQILQDPWQALHPDDRDHHMKEWWKCLSTGQQFSHKVRLRRFDDAFRWFYVRATPLMDKRLKIVHWAGTNMDIHEQHVAEMNAARQQETAASEAKYRALANSSPQIVFAVTRARGVTFCNSQWLTYSGQTEEQARGLGFMDYVHPEDLAKCRLPTFNDDGSLAVDVPTSLPPEVKRRSSSRSSSDDSSEASRTVTSPGTSSPAAVAMPQAKLSKLATAGILKVSRDLDGRPSYSTEVRLRSKDGCYRWHLVRVLLPESVHKDDVEQEEETWYGTCTDINDHKVLEQTLKDTMDAKSRFLSNMSHEIRTPLNGITGMVNFLIDSNLTAEQMEHVNIIRNSTEGLRDLINDILDLSKVEAGMITLQFEWMHLRSLIEEANDLTSAMAIDKGLELNYIVEDDVPAMVKGDRFRIRQVLLNVVGNAVKFTQRGEVFVRCSSEPDGGDDDDELPISLRENETLIKFEVIDTGAGFTEEEARFLFKRFSQIDSSSTRQHSGTGLGLAISMQLVELHGGRMKASSRVGEGSTFTFSIKFSLPSSGDQPPASAVTPGIASSSDLATLPPLVEGQSLLLSEKVASPEPLLLGQPSEINSPAISVSSVSERHKSSIASSGSSDPSIRTTQTSIYSTISSNSSVQSSEGLIPKIPPMNLELPADSRAQHREDDTATPSSHASTDTVRVVSPAVSPRTQTQSPLLKPQIYSVLVVCPMEHAREATLKHIEMTIPKSSPHHLTSRASLEECTHMFGTDDPVIFTHVVLVLRHVDDIIALIDTIFTSSAHVSTCVIAITDLAQKRDIIANSKQRYDYDQLQAERRIRFVFKPPKPSKFADIFDPQREGEVSLDRVQNSAQAVVVSQKQVFDELKRRLGGMDIRVLLVEDNRTNQMVLQKFLKKADIACEVCMDGVQCTDKVFSEPYGFYSIILCDLHMPNKDGYQTCKDIRRWERRNKHPNMPIIALSANVLGDVYEKCVDAGFNSYVTKPVDFKELSDVLAQFLDPVDKSKPHPFMHHKNG